MPKEDDADRQRDTTTLLLALSRVGDNKIGDTLYNEYEVWKRVIELAERRMSKC